MKNTILILALYFGIQLVGESIALLLGGASSAVALGRATLVINLLIIGALWATKLAGRKSAWAPAKYWASIRLLWAMGATLLLAEGITLVLDPLHLPDYGLSGKFQGMMTDPLCILGACIVAPLAEELMFRDGILRSLVRWQTPVWVAIIASGAIFGLIHGNPQQGVPAALMGVVLGVLFCRTGDLRLCLPAHILNNVVAVVQMNCPQWVACDAAMGVAAKLALGSVLLALGLVVLIYRVMKR